MGAERLEQLRALLAEAAAALQASKLAVRRFSSFSSERTRLSPIRPPLTARGRAPRR